jgi:hypothetical protein
VAEALTVNKTLLVITLDDTMIASDHVHTKARLGAQSYDALSAMLRVNTSLELELPPFETDGADERLVDSRKMLYIEQRLHEVGRGRLLASSSQTTREEWVDALHTLNCYNVDDPDDDDPDSFGVSCLYSLLKGRRCGS